MTFLMSNILACHLGPAHLDSYAHIFALCPQKMASQSGGQQDQSVQGGATVVKQWQSPFLTSFSTNNSLPPFKAAALH